jgi:hypothetical protein
MRVTAPPPPVATPTSARGSKRAREVQQIEEEDDLSPYERQRLANIRANQLALASLGVADASAALRKCVTPDKAAVDPAVRAARAAERAARLEEAQANRRVRSCVSILRPLGGPLAVCPPLARFRVGGSARWPTGPLPC